jgi:preprotein translocase subunit SecA
LPIPPIECISKTAPKTTNIFLKGYSKLLIKPNNVDSISEPMICAYNYNIIIIAKFNFVKKQGNRWIDSAIDARFTYKTEHHYLIEKDAKGINIITPID